MVSLTNALARIRRKFRKKNNCGLNDPGKSMLANSSQEQTQHTTRVLCQTAFEREK